MMPGDNIRFGKQTYQYLGHVEHTTMDGREIELVCLASECATCGDKFYLNVTEGALAARSPQTRRCREHRSTLKIGSLRDKLVCAEVRADRAEARLRAIGEAMR